MKTNSPAGRRRRAASLAVVFSAFCGCAVRPFEVRRAEAPDLLSVSNVTPALNAGPSRRRTPIPQGAATPARDRAVATVSAPVAPKPPDEGEAPLALPDANRASGPTSDLGLLGLAPSPAPSAPTIPEPEAAFPIDLSTALRLADGQNPTIGEARTLIVGALAEHQAARALLLPYLNAGTNYHDHTGPLQRSSGTILKLTEQSLYVGGGSRTLAAESVGIPAVNVFSPLADAVFEPLAARQRVIGARFNASDTANKVLLDVARLYIELVGAGATLEARRESAAEADRLAASVASYAATGLGRQSDADRADADRRLFRAAVQRAEEGVAVASASLAQRLSLDPSARLRPPAGPLVPVDLVDPSTPAEALIRSALSRRPDLASRAALVARAEYRVKQEKARPLLPTLWVGFSGGAFGGGSNLASTPLSSFAGRTDFDVRLYWTVLNLGAGNASLINRRRAERGQAEADRSLVLNRVRDEVASARAEALALRPQVANARLGLRTAEDGYLQDQARLRESLSLPIEALDSLRLLSEARVRMIEAVTRSNAAQFALFVSLGAPPPP